MQEKNERSDWNLTGSAGAVNPMLILVTFLFVLQMFLVTIHLSKKHHFLGSLSHSFVAQNICKAFFKNVTIMEKIYDKY